MKKNLTQIGFDLVSPCDNMKIVVKAYKAGYTGIHLADMLRNQGLECEFSDKNYIVLLFSIMNCECDFKRIFEIFSKIPILKQIEKYKISSIEFHKKMSIRQAYFASSEVLQLRLSEGRINAGIFSPCPPGVPLIMPGEVISKKTLDVLDSFSVKSIRVVKDTTE